MASRVARALDALCALPRRARAWIFLVQPLAVVDEDLALVFAAPLRHMRADGHDVVGVGGADRAAQCRLAAAEDAPLLLAAAVVDQVSERHERVRAAAAPW